MKKLIFLLCVLCIPGIICFTVMESIFAQNVPVSQGEGSYTIFKSTFNDINAGSDSAASDSIGKRISYSYYSNNSLIIKNITDYDALTSKTSTLKDDSTVLPVLMSIFVSSVNKRDVTLNWFTISEINNSGFEIKRTIYNILIWNKIGFVAGHGTVSIPQRYSYTDAALFSGRYKYRLKQIDYNGNIEYFNLKNDVIIGVPGNFFISQNYPNPFNPFTKINYVLPYDSKVIIKLFNISGKETAILVNENKTAGYYTLNFDASGIPSGVYFYEITATGYQYEILNEFKDIKKMIVVK